MSYNIARRKGKYAGKGNGGYKGKVKGKYTGEGKCEGKGIGMYKPALGGRGAADPKVRVRLPGLPAHPSYAPGTRPTQAPHTRSVARP